MKRKTHVALAGLLALAGMAGAVIAQGQADPAQAAAIKARKSLMTLYAYNLGTLGAMAQDKAPYDADAAKAAAANLQALSHLNAAALWPAGSDSASVEGTRALPALWENMADVGQKAGALRDATDAMAAAAGTDLDALKAAMGGLGGACGACHKAYRQPDS